ncbi:MAG: BBP7 family outer membrane beta-barrel protein [Planctomycetia bacterium]|nr:BBP7 family outer membrane beta-barrel protein [Planctomycetia bacterium]
MRIPHWPALVCGLVLAATFAQIVVAAPPGAVPRGRVALAEAIDDSDEEDEDEPAARGYDPTQRVQQLGVAAQGGVPAVAPAPEGGFVPEGAFAPGMAPPQAWPETSPFSQHRIQETYNSGGLWQYETDDNFERKGYFSAEYLYGFGLKPGNHYIGSAQYHALDFFVGAPNVFPQQTTNLFGNFNHNGVLLRTGFENPDESGVGVSAFWLFENRLDNGRVMPHAIAGRLETLTPLASVVLDNGDGTAINAPFDTRFYQQFNQEIWGSDADLMFSPFFERNTFKLRMLMGAKYLRIHEDFYVRFDDSGLGYVVDVPTDTIQLSTITNIGFPNGIMIMSASTTSQLVGPHIGVRYDLGGNKFKLWGQTRFALAANMERMKTYGMNTVQTFQLSNLNPPVTNEKSNTHISPILDTSINGDFPGFALIPYVNQWSVFKNATMRVGFNFVWVGGVARPANIIDYRVRGPLINAGAHTWFEYSAVNFAVNWNF